MPTPSYVLARALGTALFVQPAKAEFIKALMQRFFSVTWAKGEIGRIAHVKELGRTQPRPITEATPGSAG